MQQEILAAFIPSPGAQEQPFDWQPRPYSRIALEGDFLGAVVISL